MWKVSIHELINTNPIFGLQAYFGESSLKHIQNDELLNHFSKSQEELLSRNNLHNGYIQILVRNGIFGFFTSMIFFILFILNILKLNSNKVYHQYIKYLYLFYIFINLFENHIILSNSFFVLLLWIHIGIDSNILERENISKLKEVK